MLLDRTGYVAISLASRGPSVCKILVSTAYCLAPTPMIGITIFPFRPSYPDHLSFVSSGKDSVAITGRLFHSIVQHGLARVFSSKPSISANMSRVGEHVTKISKPNRAGVTTQKWFLDRSIRSPHVAGQPHVPRYRASSLTLHLAARFRP